jgi:hypothetical protein
MRIILIVILSLVGFAGGFVGVYLAMPEPPQTETAGESVPDSTTGLTPSDTLASDSLSTDRDSGALGEDEWMAEIATLVDSLSSARSMLQEAKSRITRLETRIERLNASASQRASRRDIASGMATTLPKLELKDLRPILSALTDRSLAELYEAASARNRPVILQALTSDRAALLIQQFMSSSDHEVPEETLTSGT